LTLRPMEMVNMLSPSRRNLANIQANGSERRFDLLLSSASI